MRKVCSPGRCSSLPCPPPLQGFPIPGGGGMPPDHPGAGASRKVHQDRAVFPSVSSFCTPIPGVKQKPCRQSDSSEGREETRAFPERVKAPGSGRTVSIPLLSPHSFPLMLFPLPRGSALGPGDVGEAGQHRALSRTVFGGGITSPFPARPRSSPGTIPRLPPAGPHRPSLAGSRFLYQSWTASFKNISIYIYICVCVCMPTAHL